MKCDLVVLLVLVGVFAPLSQAENYCGAEPKIPPLKTSLNLTLLQVQVITRHGDRTPVFMIGPITAPQDIEWNCTLEEYQRPTTYPDEIVPSSGRLYRKSYLPGREKLRGNCRFGQLTTKGLQQHKVLGQAIHDFYKPTGILTQAPTKDNVFVRSTDSYRTFQSAEANIYSVFPPDISNPDEIVINTMDSGTENMYDNHNLCPYISDLHKKRESTTLYKKEQETMYPVRKQVADLGYFNGDVDQVDLGSLADYVNCRRCHNYEFPPGITEEIFWESWISDEWENWYIYGDKEYANWAIGTFLEELMTNMKGCSETSKNGKCLPGYYMFSGHDSTFYPLLAAFEFTDLHYPPYASHLEMELWEDEKGEQYVRVMYNGFEINPYQCSDGKDGSFLCPFDSFYKSTQQFFAPDNYLNQCQELASAKQRKLR